MSNQWQLVEAWLQLKNASLAVVFGPRQHLGIGDRHLRCKQGISRTLQLLKHVRAGSNLGALLQTGLDWTQLHAGVSFPIIEKTSIALPHLANGWFPVIRSFLGGIDVSLHLPTTVLPCLPHANDRILMDNVLSNNFRPRAVDKINLC
jgi:hypothetical protein